MLLTEWIFGVFVRAFGVTGSGPHLIENLLLYPWGWNHKTIFLPLV